MCPFNKGKKLQCTAGVRQRGRLREGAEREDGQFLDKYFV